MNKAELADLIITNILTGGKRTTAAKVRTVLNALLDSYNTVEDGAIGPTKLNNSIVIDQDSIYLKSTGEIGNFFKLTVQDDGFIPQPLEDTGLNNIDDLINSL